jgi:peptidoglycan/LPS O-acetylase OafA/YrhL
MTFKANLDMVRSIAVSLVVIEHTLLAMRIRWVGTWDIGWLGVVGVFMFFVHTSLVLMWSLERKPFATDFYIRRFFRIYPLAVATILVIVVFHIPTMHNNNGDTYFSAPSIGRVLSNMMLVQNIAWRGKILEVMWTLPLEVDMYFLLPFFFFFVRENSGLWPVVFLWFATAAYNCGTFGSDSNTFVVCIPYFLSGVISYALYSTVRPRVGAFALPFLILALIFVFMAAPSWRHGWWLTLVLGVALPIFRPLRTRWLASAFHHLAKYSYGIYLVHPLAIAFGINFLQGHNLFLRLAAVVIAMALIVIPAYHFLEKPMIDLGSRLAARAAQPNVEKIVGFGKIVP